MNSRALKWLIGGVIAVVGTLQLWDSGVFRAGPGSLSTALALAGVALPALGAVATPRRELHVLVVLAGATLLIAARIASPVPLPELLLAAFLPTMLLLVWGAARERAA